MNCSNLINDTAKFKLYKNKQYSFQNTYFFGHQIVSDNNKS